MDTMFAHAVTVSNHPDDQASPVDEPVGAPPTESAEGTPAVVPADVEPAGSEDVATPDDDTKAEDTPAEGDSRLTRRFRQLTTRAREAEARAQAAEAALAALQQAQAATPPQTDDERFQQTVALEVQRHLTLERQREAVEQQSAAMAAKYPDFVETLQQSEATVSASVGVAIQQSPDRLELLYHFAKHPEELAVLNVADPLQVVAAIRTLGGTFRGQHVTPAVPAAPRQTQAPAPITPTRSAAPSGPPDLDTIPFHEFVRLRNAEERKARGG